MTLLRLVQRASILAGMTFASLAVHSNPVHAQLQACIITSNDKTVCGQSREIERLCITTDGTNKICGKFKSVKEDQRQEEASKPLQGSSFQKEVNKFVLTLESCKRIDENIKCQLKILNKGTKKGVGINAGGSSLVDLAGKSHPGSLTDFGTGPGSTTAEIDSKTDIIVSITFSNIPEKILKAQLLNLAFYSGITPIQFRNVPISN